MIIMTFCQQCLIMATGKFFLLLFSAILIAVSYCQVVHTSKIFMTPHETYLFFPHRHFQLVSTYTSNCSAKPSGVATQHSSLSTVAGISFNNSNLGISILSQQATSTVFYYAKINVNGICSVYEVDQSQIRILYESNFAGEFTHVVLLDRFHVFLWNCEHFVRVQYSMYSGTVSIMRGNFEVEDSWICKKYKEGGILCWGQDQITLIEMHDASFTMEVYEWDNNETIRVMLPLDINQGIFFICSFVQCNITQLLPNNTITVLDTFPFVLQILGADFNVETSQIVIIHPATAVIFTYYSRTYSLRLMESLDFYSDLQCVFIQNVRFLNEHILVNCNNFMGQAQHLALIKDRQLNRFFSYQPLRDSDPANPCLFDGNQKYIFALCKTQIVTMLNNFAYFQFKQVQSGSTVTIQCLDVDGDVIKIPQNFELTFISAEFGKAYVNQKVQNISISFDYPLNIKLKDKFTAGAIDHYTVASPDCPYLSQFYISNIDAQYFVSLYIKQKCVQIIAQGNRNFYRVLQINDTLFYIEICTLVNEGFGCQLDQIIENVSNFRLLQYNFKIFKLYIQNGNLMIVDGILTDIIFQEVSYYQMRDQIIRVKSHNKFFCNSVSNVVNNCGAWIEEQQHFLYAYSQYDIFEIDSQGNIMKYRDNFKKKINLQLPVATFSPQVRPFALPFLLSKGYYLFLINDTHITKLYDFQTTIIIYELPYNPQGYDIQSIRSVDNYFTIQYKMGFFQIYDTDRQSVAALIAVQQEQIFYDIVLMDKDVILVPLKQQNYLLRIQTDPLFHINQFPPFFNKFRQQCAFIIAPHLSNGSCPGLDPPVTQTMNLSLKFMIQKIVLLSQTLQIRQPRKCYNCTFYIPQQQFQGPIFNYEFHDDDFGTFSLVKHLNIETCEGEVEKHLMRMVQVHTADEKTRSQLLMMNATHIVLLDQELDQIYETSLGQNISCVSYTRIQEQYLLLCQHVFLLFSKNDKLKSISHNISLDNYPVQRYQIKSEEARDRTYYIFIREESLMHIGLVCLKNRQIQYIAQQSLSPQVMDFAVVRDNIITLEDGQICVSTSLLYRVSCFSLDTIIPPNFAYDYDYDDFLTYHKSENYLRTLLISKTNQNLHVDIEIDLQAKPIEFKILNAYAGYVGYTLKAIISIDSHEDGTYSNFLLHYQDTKDGGTASLIAYYPFNNKFVQSGEIGHIRSALILNNYFEMATAFTFLSFPHKLYVANMSQLASPAKQYRKCLSVGVQNKLKVVTTYGQPSLLKFLILKVNNINDIQNYYIKITYEAEDGLLNNSLIAVAITSFFFVLLAVAINRCHEVDSETTIHFMSEDIQREFSQENPSDLLHSNSSPGSPRSYSPPEFTEQPE